MIAAITESLTFNPTNMVFTLNVEHWIFGWTSSPHYCALWKYLSFSLSAHWNYRKLYLCHIGQSRFCNQAFFGTTETLTRPFLNNTSCRLRSSGRYLEYIFVNTKYPMRWLFVFILELLILNKEKRIPICLIEASFPGKN